MCVNGEHYVDMQVYFIAFLYYEAYKWLIRNVGPITHYSSPSVDVAFRTKYHFKQVIAKAFIAEFTNRKNLGKL